MPKMYGALACIFAICVACVNSEAPYQPARVYGPPSAKPAETYGPPTVVYVTPTRHVEPSLFYSVSPIKSNPVPANAVYSGPQAKPTILYGPPITTATHFATQHHYSVPKPQQVFALAYKQPQIHTPVYIAHAPITYSAPSTVHATLPSQVYGLSHINAPTTFQAATSENLATPSQEYGTPDVKPILVYTSDSSEVLAKPSTEYGAPIQVNQPTDVKPILVYTTGPESPAEPSKEYGVPIQVNKPAEVYGPPH